MRAEEAPELLLGRTSPPLRLSLEGAKRQEFALSVDDPFHRGDAQSADQLVLEVGYTYIETEAFHAVARKVGAKAGSLETPPEVALLSGIAEPSNFQVKPVRT